MVNLVDLTGLIPDAILDIRYATTNNFTGRKLYEEAYAQLESKAAEHLVEAADSLRAAGVRLVIWDSYRSPEVQQQLRAVNDDEQYVLEDSMHCQGLAIDVTLARTSTGELLDMGTDYDEFSPKAHADATELTQEQVANRRLLSDTMAAHGFKQWPYEWWHFDFVAEES